MTPRIALVLTDKGIETIAQMFKSYQEEATRREWVRTHYATLLGKVKAEQESLLRYYEMKFAERRETLAEFYSLLHKAVETGNDLHLQGRCTVSWKRSKPTRWLITVSLCGHCRTPALRWKSELELLSWNGVLYSNSWTTGGG